MGVGGAVSSSVRWCPTSTPLPGLWRALGESSTHSTQHRAWPIESAHCVQVIMTHSFIHKHVSDLSRLGPGPASASGTTSHPVSMPPASVPLPLHVKPPGLATCGYHSAPRTGGRGHMGKFWGGIQHQGQWAVDHKGKYVGYGFSTKDSRQLDPGNARRSRGWDSASSVGLEDLPKSYPE